MTNKERVINAIEGKRVDYVPMTFSIHFPKEVAFGDAAVKSHLDFYKNTGVDIMKIMNENLVPQFEKYHGISSIFNISCFLVLVNFYYMLFTQMR